MVYGDTSIIGDSEKPGQVQTLEHDVDCGDRSDRTCKTGAENAAQGQPADARGLSMPATSDVTAFAASLRLASG